MEAFTSASTESSSAFAASRIVCPSAREIERMVWYAEYAKDS